MVVDFAKCFVQHAILRSSFSRRVPHGAFRRFAPLILYITNVKGDDGSKYIYINGVEQSNLKVGLTQGDVVYAYENDDGDVAKVVVAHYTYAKVDSVSDNMSTSEENNGASHRVKLVDIDDNNLGTFYDDYDDTSKELPGFDASTYEEGTVLAVAMNGKQAAASYVANVVTGTPTSVKEAINGNITMGQASFASAMAASIFRLSLLKSSRRTRSEASHWFN